MAVCRVLIASLVLSLLVLHVVEADQMLSSSDAQTPLPNSIDCGAACATRCLLSSRPRLCKRACVNCCNKCSCVPPGTSGNLEVCPCYANIITRDNKRKCP